MEPVSKDVSVEFEKMFEQLIDSDAEEEEDGWTPQRNASFPVKLHRVYRK